MFMHGSGIYLAMTIVDHALAVVLAVVIPLYAGLFGWPRMKRATEQGTSSARIGLYWWTIVPQWSLAAAVFVLWAATGRSLEELGFRLPFTMQVWLSLGLVVAMAAALVVYQRRVLTTEEGRKQTRAALDDRAPFLPRSNYEMGHFSALSFTAGFCEELLYRAFGLWYLMEVLGSSPAAMIAAVLISSAVFGISHLYQGVSGMAQVLVVGVLTASLYLYSGCLWVVVLLHTYLDLNGGLVALGLYRTGDPCPADPGDAARSAESAGNS